MDVSNTNYTFACAVCDTAYNCSSTEQLTTLSASHVAEHAAMRSNDRAAVRLELLRRAREYVVPWVTEANNQHRQLLAEIDAELEANNGRDGHQL